MGGYDDSPAQMARDISDFCKDGLINLAGGCCGSTPPHIRAITDTVANFQPRVRTVKPPMMRLSELGGAVRAAFFMGSTIFRDYRIARVCV